MTKNKEMNRIQNGNSYELSLIISRHLTNEACVFFHKDPMEKMMSNGHTHISRDSFENVFDSLAP